ncbi:EAL domain-containing protein [Catenovulum sp. SM1970]|uniref:bifunctional diguanylate cyclase/phosphodiesterase n=1 Tax=Marinifaba aquimaris TaxID=2741323 RepID=UPI00157387E8|nr:EAL domain-containing protein [Marinifaba aquimaris]NTS78888.1 EAL domain-containing protein [Marinifaba aquimaris]
MADDFIQILDDDDNELTPVDGKHSSVPVTSDCSAEPWVIGIIDDELSVHEATIFALKNVTLYDRPLVFYSAYSAKEGFELIKSYPEMALILLDVVMESDNAGLELVDRIRNELNNALVQIVLRTGQAGYAPEEEVIIRYEINSYKTKTELTRKKLFTVLAAGLRSFQQLRTIEQSRDGLRAIVDASASLMQERFVFEFSSGVLTQIDALFDLASESLFCVSQRPAQAPIDSSKCKDGYYVVAADTKYSKYFGCNIKDIQRELPIMVKALQALEQKQHVFTEDVSCLYLSTPSGWEGVIVATGKVCLATADQELLQIFCMNVALGLENAKFFSHLNKAAFHDELTNLYNRAGLIEEGIQYCQLNRTKCTLYLIDIDYFHHFIASLGYELGNAILQKVADILRQLFGKNTIIARVHSDAYAVIVADATLSANEVAVRCSRPIVLEGQSIRIGLTVGTSSLSYSDESSPDIGILLRRAEMALNVAKEQKRGSGEVFDEAYEIASRKSMTLLSDFRIGIDQQELFLVLQPKVGGVEHQVIGFEALLRWKHPKKGMIPPGAFIASVEKSGMHYELDLYVARALCDIINANPEVAVPISFNISANSLNHESFVNELHKVFTQNNVELDKVEVEVTENALIHSELAISRLNSLVDKGFVICLDDFGAGFSSLSYLLRLPLTTIKIDRAFVANITSNSESLTIIRGIIEIIQSLKKDVIVEGVENEEQLALLKGLGVEKIQGFYFYKPMLVEKALALLSR